MPRRYGLLFRTETGSAVFSSNLAKVKVKGVLFSFLSAKRVDFTGSIGEKTTVVGLSGYFLPRFDRRSRILPADLDDVMRVTPRPPPFAVLHRPGPDTSRSLSRLFLPESFSFDAATFDAATFDATFTSPGLPCRRRSQRSGKGLSDLPEQMASSVHDPSGCISQPISRWCIGFSNIFLHTRFAAVEVQGGLEEEKRVLRLAQE